MRLKCWLLQLTHHPFHHHFPPKLHPKLQQVSLIGVWEQYLNELKLSSKTPVLSKMPTPVFESEELIMVGGASRAAFQRCSS